LAKQLKRSTPEADRETALEGLRDLYDRTFKAEGSKKISAYRRNVISLFLYSGPIGRVALVDAEERIPRHRLTESRMAAPRFWGRSDRFGQMFTGDGYLKTAKQWSAFHAFFRDHDRFNRAAVFQVMHHGSQANWHAGLASGVKPVVSIFCSDPAGHLSHPDLAVLQDFEPFNPKQVDAFHGWW
jgi:hypothetical protein